MRMPVLNTERLCLRPFSVADYPACDRLFQEVWRTDARREWIEWASRNPRELENLHQPPYGDRAIVLRESSAIIGSAGLVPSFGPFCTLPGFDREADSVAARRHTPEIGLFWMLSPKHRGKGYATEAAQALIDFAFTEMNARRLVATTEYDNLASLAVMRRLNMRIERNPHLTPEWFQAVGVLFNT